MVWPLAGEPTLRCRTATARGAPHCHLCGILLHALQLSQLPNDDVANLGGVVSSDLLLDAGQMSWSGKHLLCASWVVAMTYKEGLE